MRIRLIRLLVVFALLAFAMQLAAFEGTITGFADARAGYTFGDSKELGFAFHSSRIIFGARLAPWISSTVHLGTNPWAPTTISLGTAMVTLNSVGDGPLMSLSVGRFPVPMGLANGWFLSPGNPFAFAPGITTGLLGTSAGQGWSDVGALGTIKANILTLQAYAVQGNIPGGKVIISTPDNKGIAGGLRAVITPFAGLNIGLSYCLNGREAEYTPPPTPAVPAPVPISSGDNKSIIAGDIAWTAGPVTLSAEYLAAMPKFSFDERIDAWFAQFEFDLKDIAGIPITPGVRFDYLTTNLTGADAENAITIQAAYKFEKYLRIGLSFRTSKQEEDQLMLQVLTMF